MKRNE